jgi:hypothetical protein
VALLLIYTLAGPEADKGVVLAIGALGGSAAGAILSGRFVGATGQGITAGGQAGIFMSCFEVFGPNDSNYVALGLVGAGVAVGFTVGALLQISQATRMRQVSETQSSVKSARKLVLAKALWGTVGAILGAAFVCLHYLGVDDYDYEYMAAVGAIGGGLIGAVFGGGRFGRISRTIFGCLIVAVCLLGATASGRRVHDSAWNGPIVIALGIFVGFALGAMLELWDAREDDPQSATPDTQS